MTNDLRGQTIALAAVLQSAILVDRFARLQEYSEADAKSLVNSIFATDPQNLPEVYDGLHHLVLGLTALSSTDRLSKEVITYFNSMLVLQKKLRKEGNYLNIMGSGIENIKGRLVHFPMMHENIQMALADLYTQTISKLTPRIYVKGTDQSFLSSERNASLIRTLLLAGVRSGILWHQCGGTTFKRIFHYQKISTEARSLLNQILA